MSDRLAVIERVIEEHKKIGGHMKLLGESLNDAEALAELEKAFTEWIPGRPEAISEKQGRLVRAVSFLGEGLENHFSFEERALPPLLGDLLMRALMLEHREILKEIEEAKSLLGDPQAEGLSREGQLVEESRIQQRIGVMSRRVEDHAEREELILEMVRKALEEEARE
jgi:hypothetical protein